MKRCVSVVLLGLVALLCAGAQFNDPQREHTTRFEAVEVWIDTQGEPLAAYQLDFRPTHAEVKIVGIEGAAPGSVFADPPYYDPAAMMSERVIIADFSTAPGNVLPQGKFRLATIHVQITGDIEPEYNGQLDVAATTDGRSIPADVTLEAGSQS